MENDIRTEKQESPQLKSTASYSDNRIAIIDNPHALMGQGETVKTEAYAACLCTKGKGSLYIDNTLHEININDLFICHPNIIVEHYMTSLDCETRTLVMSPEYIRNSASSAVLLGISRCF